MTTAPEYNRPYTLKFNDTHMVICFTDRGVAKTQAFELHRTRPEGVFPRGIYSVRTKAGRVLEYGGIPRGLDIDWVCWPVEDEDECMCDGPGHSQACLERTKI